MHYSILHTKIKAYMKTYILIGFILLSLSQTAKASHPQGQGRLHYQSRAPQEIKFSNTSFSNFKKSSYSTVVLDPNDFKEEEKTHLEELQELLKKFYKEVVLKHSKSTLPLVSQQAIILYLTADKHENEGAPLLACLQAKIAAIKGALPHDEK